MGYVGLPLAMEYADAGIRSSDRHRRVQGSRAAGREVVHRDVPSEAVKGAIDAGLFTTDHRLLGGRNADTVNICVPTRCARRRIRTSPTSSARWNTWWSICTGHADRPREHNVSRDDAGSPRPDDRGRASRWARTSSSPSRPSGSIRKPEVHDEEYPKVVGGVTPACTKVAVALYSGVLEHVHPVSTARWPRW